MQGNKYTPVAKRALVAFGSNLPAAGLAPKDAVCAAIDRLAAIGGGPLIRSRLWTTPAFPPGSGPEFVNAAAALDWGGSAEELLDALHGIEAAFGRSRTARWEARIMDLDLLALGDLVLPDREEFLRWQGLPPEEAARRTPDRLILPHPRMAERGFVLAPLAEVAPDWRHPVLGATVAEMLASLPPAALEGVAPIDPGA